MTLYLQWGNRVFQLLHCKMKIANAVAAALRVQQSFFYGGGEMSAIDEI